MTKTLFERMSEIARGEPIEDKDLAAQAAASSFEEDNRVERRDPDRHRRGSAKRSHRAEGRNHVD